MGIAAVVLGCGDAFHLIPRVLNYFLDRDMSVYLGVGKLVTSITMTVFYVLLYRIWIGLYEEKENMNLSAVICCTAILRIALCFFPQNGWFENSSDMTWGIIRNIPFVLLGAAICRLYFRKRREDRIFAPVWVYILLSFLFYIPVAAGAGAVPMLGMLMLPKTVCYMLIVWSFYISCKDI